MEKFWNVPNVLTIIRFLLVPVYWVLFFFEKTYIPALFIFLTACITDLVDGIIARKFNQVTKYGKVLDPLADKVMQVSALITLVIAGRLHWAFAVIIFAKELYMVVSASFLYKRKVVVSANIIGKIATVVMSIGIVLLFFDFTLEAGRVITNCGIGISVLAAINYTYVTFKQLNGKLPHNDNKEEININ